MIGVLKGIVEGTSLLFYVCAYPPSGDLSGAALEVPSEALLHPRSYVRIMQPILQTLTLFIGKSASPYCTTFILAIMSKLL